VPQLPPLPRVDRASDQSEDEEEDDSADQQKSKPDKRRRPSAEPRVVDPYAAEDPSSMMLPVFVAIGAFIPLVFCLCRL